jgi:CRISPR-associated endonuclease Csn1
MATVLGLDIGAASIGWALLDPAAQKIIASGVRVFPEGVARDTSGAEQSRNQQRRLARQQRRQFRRRAARLRRVRGILGDAGLLWASQEQLERADPYALRAKALDAPLAPWELGVVLFHLAQRRGFRGSRAGNADGKDGPVYEDISALKQEILSSQSRTLGEHFHKLRGHAARKGLAEPRVRGRHTTRAMYEAEFAAIVDAQTPHHAGTLTPDLRERLRDALFFQRRLKPTDELIGHCELDPAARRCAVAHRAAQRFRIAQEVTNLRVIAPDGQESELTSEQAARVRSALAGSEKQTFEQLRKLLGFSEQHRFNLEQGKRTTLYGNRTDAKLRSKSVFGAAWQELAEDEKDRIVELLLREDDLETLERYAREVRGLSSEQAHAFARVELQPGFLSYSVGVIRKLTPHLERGALLRHKDRARSAIHLAGFTPIDEIPVQTFDRLPHPPTDIRNPLVLAALHQVRRVVNAIVHEYGKPGAIHIELAREIQGGIEQRRERTIAMRKRERERDDAAELIRTNCPGVRVTRDAIDRYLLWRDMKETCPYSGKTIPLAGLFGPDVEVDHILPYSRSLDDSFANKTVCYRDANRDKGQRTPFEWLGGDDGRFEAMIQRVRHLGAWGQRSKARKFTQQTCELEDFIARQLSDTAYICRQTAAFMRHLGVDVVCVKGQSTADLRERWGLNSVLRDDGLNLKNRDDFRHHAVDAIVVALTDRSRLQALATFDPASQRREKRLAVREQAAQIDKQTGELFASAQPWTHFREQVEASVNAINVSHRPQRRVRGALHEDTYYGKTSEPGVYTSRKPLAGLKPGEVERIRDEGIRKAIVLRAQARGRALDDAKEFPKDFWNEPLFQVRRKPGTPRARDEWETTHIPVRSVTVAKRDSTIQALGATGLHVKPGSNHHVCIFEYRDDKGKVRRDAVWCSLLEAVRRLQHREPVVRRMHTSIREATFLMSLCPGDLLQLEHAGVTQIVKFVTGSSTTNQLRFAYTRDGRARGDQLPLSKNPGTLNARKVTVDLLGRVRWAGD